MAEIEFILDKGIKVGEVCHTKAILRDPTSGDVIDASVESEKVVLVPVAKDDQGEFINEPQLVTSPTLLAAHVLRRQIVRIGDLEGPFEMAMLRKLSPSDMNLMQKKAAELEDASLAVAQRGRSEHQGAADNNGD